MILKGSVTRSISHARRLGRHLLNERDNDSVTVHEVSGHATDDPERALRRMHGTVVLTRGTIGAFQVSINPEQGETMTPAQWKDAITKLEKEFGFEGQPRVVIGHVKEGREHRHCVWQRTDLDAEKLIPIDDYKTRLKGLSREMEREYGHQFVDDKTKTHPFDQAAFRQAKRNNDRDPRERSAFIRQAWERSESADHFRDTLKEAGYELALGNRSRFVLVDAGSGEILRGSLARHLKGADQGAPKAAELRTWAQGLSAPLDPVEAIKERLREEQYFDRDAYNAEQEQRAIDAGISAAIEEDKDRKQQARDAARYKSYADQIDPILKREAEAQRQRLQKQEELREAYRTKHQAEELRRKKAELAELGLIGRISGRKAELEEEVNALERTLRDTQQRIAEQRAQLERRMEEQGLSQPGRRPPTPANDVAPPADQTREEMPHFPDAPDASSAFKDASGGPKREGPQPEAEKLSSKMATKAEQERLEAQRETPQAAPGPSPPGSRATSQARKQRAVEREEEIQRIQRSRDAASQQFGKDFRDVAPEPANESKPEPETEEQFLARMRAQRAERKARSQTRGPGRDR